MVKRTPGRITNIQLKIISTITIISASFCHFSTMNAIRKFSGLIPIKKLRFDYCRASGPGGQHVNKTNSKVSLSFHVESAEWLPEETRKKLAELHTANLNKDGYLTIRSDKTRSQTLNVADCMDKLRAYIGEAEQPPEAGPSPETIELMRLRLDRAAAERLKTKKIRGAMLRDSQESRCV